MLTPIFPRLYYDYWQALSSYAVIAKFSILAAQQGESAASVQMDMWIWDVSAGILAPPSAQRRKTTIRGDPGMPIIRTKKLHWYTNL